MNQEFQNQVVEFVFDRESTATALRAGASALFRTHRSQLTAAGELLRERACVPENRPSLQLVVAEIVLDQLAGHLWGQPRPGHADRCIIWYAADKAAVSSRPPYWISDKDLKT